MLETKRWEYTLRCDRCLRVVDVDSKDVELGAYRDWLHTATRRVFGEAEQSAKHHDYCPDCATPIHELLKRSR
jgi:hypothetical protein